MRKYWRPGLRVWWRCEGEAQLGQDPPTIVFGLAKQEHVLLDAFAHADPQLDCWSIAMSLGWRKDRYLAFTDRLPEHAFVDSPTVAAGSVQRYWSVAQTVGAAHSTARFEADILVDGLAPIGVQIVDALCRAGVDTVYLADVQPVGAQDVYPGGFRTDDVGRERAQAAMHRLRPRHPLAHLHTDPHPAYLPVNAPPPSSDPANTAAPARGEQAPSGHAGEGSGQAAEGPQVNDAPDRMAVYAPELRQAHRDLRRRPRGVSLAVVTASGALPAHRVRPYEASQTPVLPVVIRELDIMIGPLLVPPGPCLRCLHLTLTDADPRWPALATQMAAETNPGIDPIVTDMAAAVAAHQVVAFADQRPTAVAGTSLHIDGIHPVPRVQRWYPHRDCGCRLDDLAA